jgi:flagellar biosynthesis anti-sigma factor FlgM
VAVEIGLKDCRQLPTDLGGGQQVMKVHSPARPSVTHMQDKGHGKNTGSFKIEVASSERVSASNRCPLLSEVPEPDSANAEKVEKLRESIRVGAFKVDLEQVASRMLQEER